MIGVLAERNNVRVPNEKNGPPISVNSLKPNIRTYILQTIFHVFILFILFSYATIRICKTNETFLFFFHLLIISVFLATLMLG